MAGINDNRWSLVALAVVSMSNRPLLSQLFLSDTATRQDELNLQFLLHSSLDVCDERVDARARRDAQQTTANNSRPNNNNRGGPAPPLSYCDPNKQSPCFLDKLLQSQRYWSWGYQSASSIRILAITHGDAPRDAMHQILKQTYDNVSLALSNPFFEHDATLDSDAFLMKITHIATPYIMRRVPVTEMM